MATRNKRKLAALNKENCEEHPRSNLGQNSNVPRSQEDYITQVSEEIEGRVTKKLSQEFSRTENRILGALARLDDFLVNPLLQGHSGTTPETSRNVFSVNQGTNEDDSQSDPHPEAGLLISGREDRHDMVPGVQRESVDGCDMTTSMNHKYDHCVLNWGRQNKTMNLLKSNRFHRFRIHGKISSREHQHFGRFGQGVSKWKKNKHDTFKRRLKQ